MTLQRKIIWASAAALLLCAAAARRPLRAILLAINPLPTANADRRIRAEPGASSSAALAADALPDAIADIERRHGRDFLEPPRLVVCATQESFNRRIGADPRGRATGAVFLNRIYLSPRSFDEGAHSGVIRHELSHLHLRQHLGALRGVLGIPRWFQEGLAVHVSGGAGTASVSRADALRAMCSGTRWVPETGAAWLTPRGPREHGLSHGQFYRQSAVFVEYLEAHDPNGFRRFLEALLDGADFEAAAESFSTGIPALWERCLDLVCPGVDEDSGERPSP